MLKIFILLSFALAILSTFYHWTQLHNFLKRVPRIQSSNDLESFKKMAASQMYGALAQIVLLGVPFLLYWIGFYSNALAGWDIWMVLVPAIVIVFLSLRMKITEKTVQSIPATGDDLTRQRDFIVYVWKNKPLPQW